MNHSSHFFVMTAIMIVSGFLSTMNVWANSYDDLRLSLNDVYMVLLMTGWMLFFMGLYYSYTLGTLVGLSTLLVSLYAIRTQLFISERQFLLGMIPHHSMAVHMSKKLQQKPNTLSDLLKNIIESQQEEIVYMKRKLEFS
jgi:hypothetical protein